MRTLLLAAIVGYRRYLSPYKGFCCAYPPIPAVKVVRSWVTVLYADMGPWSASCSCAGAFICVA